MTESTHTALHMQQYRCENCGNENDDVYLKDVSTGRIYCEVCATVLHQVCYGENSHPKIHSHEVK